jgi:HK97 family phage prohead protease
MTMYEQNIATKPRSKEHLDCWMEIKSLDEDGRFAGYASVFDLVDSQRDIMEKGAFDETLKDRVGQIKLLWQHSFEEPIGYFTRMFEDARGLYVEGQLLLDVARAKEAYALLKHGVVKGLSIGYSPRRFRTDPDSGVRRIAQVDLWEVSLVTFPANEQAQVSVVKSAEDVQWARSGALMELWDAVARMERAISSS